MQKITPHLWFDKEAKEAAGFYVSAFDEAFGRDSSDSELGQVNTLHDTPSGTVETVGFRLLGKEFASISAGPLFKFNPSVSFTVYCKTAEEVDSLWKSFSKGGTVLMELGSYPWSKKYGWIRDRYGLSWQLSVGESREIVPTLLFVKSGKAREAIEFYASVFRDSKIKSMLLYGKGEHEPEGTVKYSNFILEGMNFSAMDGSKGHQFTFNEAISFIVNCETQEEIDYYWEKLSSVPESEQCGWLKDRFGLSWQIVPSDMGKMLASGDRKKIDRVTQSFLKMKKLDLKELQKAAEGK